MTEPGRGGAADEELRRRLLGFADGCARDFQGSASQVLLVATALDELFRLTESGSPADTTEVWALCVAAGAEPFIHVRLGPSHPKRGLLLVLRRSDLQLVQRGVADEPFDLAALGPAEVLRSAG
jgi:hypothetical protein